MSRHTPGPWQAVFFEYGGYDCMSGAWDIRSGSQSLATVDQNDYGQLTNDHVFRSPEAEANARLIALAPELLNLVYLVSAGNTEFEDLEHAASELIAKLEGQSL